jgi:hypothetical protein
MLVLQFYSGLSGRVRMVYLFNLCAVSLSSSRFTASALVRFSYFLQYLVFQFFISLSTVFMDPVVDACPGISLHFSGVDQHCPFAFSDRFGCTG